MSHGGGYAANSQLASDLQEKSNDVDPRTEELHLCQHSHFCPAEFSLVNDEPWETHPFPADKVSLWEHKLPSVETQRDEAGRGSGESYTKKNKKTRKWLKAFLHRQALNFGF